MSPHDEEQETGADLKVLSFNKDDDLKSTIHDINHKGKTYKLKVDACPGGFHLRYLTQVKKADYTPGPFKSMVDPDELAYVCVADCHVAELTWRSKLWWWTLERKTLSYIRDLRKDLIHGLDLNDRALAFQEAIECK